MFEPIKADFRLKSLILASASPRRREIMEKMGLRFDILPVDCDEHTIGAPRDAVKHLARRKAEAAAQKVGDGWIIGADTLVALDERTLGKPKNSSEAAHMLRSLSGRAHFVYTGVCLLDAASGRMLCEVGESQVQFRPLTDREIGDYVASGEPMDKAGAYAIQGGAASFVERYTGEQDNIIGLPSRLLMQMINEMGNQSWQS